MILPLEDGHVYSAKRPSSCGYHAGFHGANEVASDALARILSGRVGACRVLCRPANARRVAVGDGIWPVSASERADRSADLLARSCWESEVAPEGGSLQRNYTWPVLFE